MKTIDLSKPVKFKNPQPGEENLTYKVTNINEVTNRCYIEVVNLPGFNNSISPSELVSIEDIENAE
jgi:hypothetical protein